MIRKNPGIGNQKSLHRPPPVFTNEIREAWQSIRRDQTVYRNPYFAPEFFEALIASGMTAELAVQREHGEIVGLLPFQRHSRTSVAIPAGGGLNDCHGPIMVGGKRFDWNRAFRENQFQSYQFHACPKSLPEFENRTEVIPSFLADLNNHDAASYEEFLSRQHRTIARQGQKDRRLERELGPLRLEFDCRDQLLLQKLMDWKSAQYRRTYITDIFSSPWVRKLLFQLHARRTNHFRGLLSVLFAGQVPVGIHFGILTEGSLHYWYPTYDPKFKHGSPGTRLFLEIANQSPAHGISTIDFGYGDLPYKHTLTNQRSQFASGIITNSTTHRLRYHSRRLGKNLAKRMWFKEHLKPLVRQVFPSSDRQLFTSGD
ncbi:MAG: GNAT family N-acetyltransferase [Pirellulaceae bacterium]